MDWTSLPSIVDGAAAVLSTWRVEAEDPLDVGNVEIVDGMHARAGRLALNARMTDARACSTATHNPPRGRIHSKTQVPA